MAFPVMLIGLAISLIIQGIKTAEVLLGPGTGEQKKPVANAMIGAVIDTMATISTGGQQELWNGLKELKPHIGGLIDTIVPLVFCKGETAVDKITQLTP